MVWDTIGDIKTEKNIMVQVIEYLALDVTHLHEAVHLSLALKQIFYKNGQVLS